MSSIDPSKIAAETKKPDAAVSNEVAKQAASTSVNQERLLISQLLKQTLSNLTQNGLLSVNIPKALLNARQILPGEYTQLYIQDKVVQQKQAAQETSIRPKELTLGTIRQWTTGQLIQSVVYEQTQNNLASLLVNGSGQFDKKILSQVILQGNTQQSAHISSEQQTQLQSVIKILAQVMTGLSAQKTLPISTQSIPSPIQVQIKSASDILTQPGSENPQAQIKSAAKILNQISSNFSLLMNTSISTQANSETPQVQIKSAAKMLTDIAAKISLPANNTLLSANPINNKIIQQSQVVQIKTELSLQAGQQLLLQVHKKSGKVSFQIQHAPMESHKISQYLNQHTLKQQALPQLLASLKDISSQIAQSKTALTPQFAKQVDRIIQHFPQLAELSTIKEIKNILQNSGQFLENKLLTTIVQSMKLTDSPSKPITNTVIQQISQADFKANLAQLIVLIQKNEALILPKNPLLNNNLYQHIEHKALFGSNIRSAQSFDLPAQVTHAQVQKPAPDANLFQLNSLLVLQSKVLDQLEGVLSRIISTQLQTRERGTDQIQLNFEIPFRNNDQQEVLQLKIREEIKENEAQKGNKIWTVNLAFHLQSLGGIRIYITLDKQDLSMQFWTEEKNTQQLFQTYFSLLTERLHDAGFTISKLGAFHGIPETAKKEQQDSQFIIDERV
ncbi:MAG: flagellar hook-length control protein FliK [gamma proteobacterium symbiont of Taylorina sp.]|nr:flagellar hook-length control protein FliK [gamma proteobacterium symbiont of Taylorina sp.]